MVQTRIEEKIETIDQEIHGIKKEIRKLPAIEKTLNDISKNMDKQNQLILRIMESAAQERSTMNERISELSLRTFSAKIIDESEGSSRRENETKNEEKKSNDEGNNDRNKFKKVEMPIFNGDDPDSWLFRVERGYKRFLRRSTLENSDYLKDDCLQINCTVGVVVSSIERPHSQTISIPESNIGAHFGALLENLEGSDVTFDVDGEKFQAHRLILAARSPMFRSEFLHMLEESKEEIFVKDLEPNVFKALLYFIYTDSIAEDVVVSSSSSSSDSDVGDHFMAKLLAAADKYGLERLRLMCESHLCKNLSVRSVAQVLSFAEEHHATELKAVCLRFAAMNLGAVMQSKGFEHLKENNPSLQSELLKILAQNCGDVCSNGSKSRSVWAQLSDGGDSNGRRVRQRT